MADSIDPNANGNKISDFLPRVYRTDSNKKFLQATIDQLVQPGTVNKINGFIGRQNAKASTGDDIFLAAATPQRQHYQLEPGLVVNDQLGNNTFFKDYQDYINQLGVFGSNTSNHARLNKQEFYSWDPHIDWDKFVNFQNYYWLPYGPDVVAIVGQQENIVSEYKVTVESEGDNNTYVFWPDGLIRNPVITLYRGQTYKFDITSPGNPFSIKTVRSVGTLNRYQTPGLDGVAVENGILTFTVPFNAPDVLFYNSEIDADLGGTFHILSIDDNTAINVGTDILGKKTYTLSNGTNLTNGMKVRFLGNVLPESYATGYYYVEGVGTAIKLVDEKILELVSSYTLSESVLFDSTPFDSMPFSDATSFAGTRDYIVINRSSIDHNPWSRYNRWFHKDAIAASATYNNKSLSLDQTARAVRPIIEFEANLKLFNFGTQALADVDLVDTFTTDAFSTIEGSLGYNVDGITLTQNQRILFTADTDNLVKNNVYQVKFVTIQGTRQIHLELVSTAVDGNVVLVKQGIVNQGKMFWLNGTRWTQAQQKLTLNQAPLFDIFDSNKVSYGDTTVYDGSTFNGTPIFSYKAGTGTTDANIGFALSYKNINNIGDIVFNFNLASDSFQYKSTVDVIAKNTNVGYIQRTASNGVIEYVNGWQKCTTSTLQAALRIYKNSNKTNNFDLDIFDDKFQLDDLVIKLYVNGIRLDPLYWSVKDGPVYKNIVLTTDILTSDVLTIKAFASQSVNSNGYYEIPVNLQNNPLNSSIGDFTLGEVIDHVGSIVDNASNFIGTYPGPGNLRDLGNITQYGTKFVQHSGPASLAMYHITSETNNIVRAIETARDDYNKFKRNFISVAEILGVDTDTIGLVDLILEKINKDKPTTSPYYFSDMVPYGANIKATITVIDPRTKTYPLSSLFNLDSLSTKAVCVYLNNVQLLAGREYTFSDQGFIVVSATLAEDDIITIYEYENTNGSFVPETPTKLGIWPKYTPKIYTDTSLITPRVMIQGHDGSQVLAYGDYRDDLILELEKRIYNNIKVQYNPDIFNIYDIIPGYNRTTDYSLTEFNSTLAPNFYKWTSLIDRDFTKPLSFDPNDSFTYNYRGLAAPDGRETPGYWRGVYRWLLDTDRPNICPWEILGFSEEPTWWTSVYGPAPYTSDNLLLWQDIAAGFIKEPGKPLVVLDQFKHSYLVDHIPVDAQGNLISPLLSGLSSGTITTTTSGDFVFGDVSPVEATWRRSSHYPFSVLLTAMILQPAKTFGTLLDRSRIVRNLAGQLVYADTELRISPADIMLPSIYSSTTNVQTAGIINYVVDYILSDNLKSYDEYNYNLQNLKVQLSYRVGGFTSKAKINLLLDSKTPLSTGSVFVPQEDYDIILNSSSPVKKITYSGVIITKLSDGFEVKGYSKTQPYFNYYAWTRSGSQINVGGISESYTTWTVGSQYATGKIVFYGKNYYRVKVLHTAVTFEAQNYQLLPTLPIIGGRDAILRKEWDRTEAIVVPYGTKFRTVQEVVDFITGYGEYLKDQGFIFDDFNNALAAVTNWETSAKEFLFWTTQNWSTGEDKWEDWLPETDIAFGSIVAYNGDYYRAIRNSAASLIFNEDDFVKLDGLSTIGSSVISLSPSADKLTFSTSLCVVDDIRNAFNGYEIFKVDGTPIAPNFLNNYRDNNQISYTPQSEDGIYGASFYLIQKEQVVILNNTTMFNDTIYNAESGYRQERIKVAGYVSTNWYGGFDVPGFVFDQATIQLWEAWKDYSLGDIVKYKEFYFSANTGLPGTETFDVTQWIKLDKKPTAQLLPNWTYKAGQFEDFYSLDSDNFDVDQQKLAQHLVGYQKRQYLENIIQDDVSEFKFYQGMIAEKGTQNVLNKLFDVLSADNQESLKFYEEWALRVGQYGANAAYENIEFILDEAEFKNNPQGFELTTVINSNSLDFISRQTPADIYVKPLGYNNNPWPVISNYKSYLRTPGYVRSSEVLYTIKSIDNISDTYLDATNTAQPLYPISSFSEGSYVWCGFEAQEWNVYRYTASNLIVSNVTYDANAKTITIITDGTVTLPTLNSTIGITGVTAFSGFFKVLSVDSTSFVISKTITSLPFIFTEGSTIKIASLTSQRAVNLYNENNQIILYAIDRAYDFLPTNLAVNELLWTDDDGTGKWATWKYSPVYSTTELVNTSPANDLQFGRKTILNTTGTISVVSNNLGELIVYDKASLNAAWIQRQVIVAPFISIIGMTNPTPSSFTGDVLAISADSRWFATGTPLATNVASLYQGAWNSSVNYTIGQIVRSSTSYYQVIALPAVGAFPIPTNTTYWKQVPYIPVSNTGSNSALSEQGVISIYEKDKNNIFTLVDTILSPYPAAGEHFGSSLAFGIDTLLVGANGYNTGAGQVYQLTYLTVTEATTYFNPVGSTGTTIKVLSTANITAGMAIVGTGFNSNQTVVTVVNSTTLILNSVPDSNPDGLLSFTTTKWRYNSSVINTTGYSGVGTVLETSNDGSTLLVTATSSNAVIAYNLVGSNYQFFSALTGPTGFGTATAVSTDGQYIAISSNNSSGTPSNQGSVVVYTKELTGYTVYQTIQNLRPEASAYFGRKLAFMNDYATLVVYSQTTAGKIDIYDRYSTNWIYSETLTNTGSNGDSYGSGLSVGSNIIFVGAKNSTDQSIITSGKVYEYRKASNSYSWFKLHTEIEKPDVRKIKQAFLYNRKTNKLITYLDVIDSSQGKIPGIAEQEIKYKTFFDPAVYSVGNSAVTVDDGMAWTTTQVGMLWWNLQTAKFYNSYDDDVVYRNSSWNTIFPEASIDVYEWVESKYKPSEWDALADTEAGLAINISGQSLYGNIAYSTVKRYDNVAKAFKLTYYYWVKNKKTIPSVANRNMSSLDVANLISNPRGQGYKYLALTSSNSFSLVNVKPELHDTDIVLSVEYWIVDNINNNIHTQWKLISDNTDTVLPSAIEEKWFDSLCGKDSQGRLVPDTALPLKLQYGVENRPRQGMFVNRFEALKQLIEQVNRVLIKQPITEQRDISGLNSYDAEPSTVTGTYDTAVDTVAELDLVGAGIFIKPVLTPIITNGKITGINILTKGNGYLVSPYIEVVGSGTGAKLRAIINSYGQVTGATIINSGYGYNDAVLIIRNYSVLVHSDNVGANTWSIYTYEPATRVWSRVQSQTYDTRNYWNYVDWFATGYNQFVASDFAISTLAEINSLTVTVGQLVKVLTDNNGNWMLLKKYADGTSVDWTQSYNVVGLQNGTLQFSSSLYDFAGTRYGYDGSLYDGSIFDNSAAGELRNILTALKDHILIDDLRQQYLDLFFTCVRYALSEQNYLDWIFKTSFVKVKHNVGELKQKVTYNNDNLSNFEDYVAEVKPYRTKVREYISGYSKLDTNSLSITDFDLQPVYDNGKLAEVNVAVIDGKIQIDSPAVQTYPWKHWLDNVGFTITSLIVVDGGSGYLTEPVVRITNNSGSGATARALIANGKVNRIILTHAGTGYLSAPTVTIDGGLATNGVAARVVAIIGDSVVRSNLIKMKFDRITQAYFIQQLQETETLTNLISGSRVQFPLVWAPDIRIGKATVTINGVDALRDSYRLSIVKSTSRGYTSYSGSIIFDTAPAIGSTLTVTYLKDWSLLNAADRIQYYYNPTTGELGKDLAQLMTGIDYGGVIVNGLGFDVSAGWDSLPFYSDKWDSYDSTFKDYIYKVKTLPFNHSFDWTVAGQQYIPEAGTEINVYYSHLDVAGANPIRLDDPHYGVVGWVSSTLYVIGAKISHNGYYYIAKIATSSATFVESEWTIDGKVTAIPDTVIMMTPIATGASSIVTIPSGFLVSIGDKFIIRENTSDGSIKPQDADYDTALSGGQFEGNYSTGIFTSATGLRAEDIIVDGDGFVTPTTSPAPEEVVPGQVVDSLAIKVYDRPSSGAASIKVDSYIADGIEKTFKISQQLNSPQAIIVKTVHGVRDPITDLLSSESAIKTSTLDYTLDYRNSEITFVTAPTAGYLVSIFSFGFNGSNILDLDYFISDGTTTEFITKAPWLAELNSIVYVDGVVPPIGTPQLFRTDGTYESANKVGIKFGTAPSAGALINFVIVSGTDQTFSITKTEQIPVNGSDTYALSNIIGDALPIESNMIVRVDQTILKGPNNSYFKIKSNKYNYAIDPAKFLPYSVSISDIVVLANGLLLRPGVDYNVDLSGITVQLNKSTAQLYAGFDLIASIRTGEGYLYIPPSTGHGPQIKFSQLYDNTHIVEVISSYKHDILDIQRTAINVTSNLTLVPDTAEYYNYVGLSGGYFELDRTVVNDNYVWVIKNGTLLTPSADFKLNTDKKSITLALLPELTDEFTLITFGSNILTSGIAYMQFKDMLNRVHFKRLSLVKQTTLVRSLKQTDVTIEVTDASNFDSPSTINNRPGIVEIRGERIEYFSLTPTVTNGVTTYLLGQLRRGTLGTGTPAIHKAGSFVQDIGASETLPYTESSTTETVVSDGTNIVKLSFLPEASDIITWFTNFGYRFVGEFNNAKSYVINDVVSYNGYYYANIATVVASATNLNTTKPPTNENYWELYSSIPVGYYQNNDIEVFAAGTRLKKKPYELYSVSLAPESPEGDVRFDAEFAVNGTTNEVRLTTANVAPLGTTIVVVKRIGTVWDSTINIQDDTNKIAKFLKAEPGIWYSEYKS